MSDLPKVDGLLTLKAQQAFGDAALVVQDTELRYVLHLNGQPFIVLASHPLDEPNVLWKHAKTALAGLCRAEGK